MNKSSSVWQPLLCLYLNDHFGKLVRDCVVIVVCLTKVKVHLKKIYQDGSPKEIPYTHDSLSLIMLPLSLVLR